MSELRAGDRFGRYVIERELGRGGMGAVFLARDESLRRPVALKVIATAFAADAEFHARFEREARIAATLEHPHVVPVYDAGDIDGRLFIAMRFVDGTDLASELDDAGHLPAPRVARVLADVCAALDGAHRAGLVHRDVKPANVLLTGSGSDEHAYLADFGLTRDAGSDSGLTGTGQFVGTIDYVAPEQIEGGRVDARTDVYSAACLAFHALTGRIPFVGAAAAKLHGHLGADPPRATDLVADLPPAADAVLARGMAKEPEARYPSAGDLARDLAAALSGQPNLEPTRTVATGRALTGIPTIAETPVDRSAPTAAAQRLPRPPRSDAVAPAAASAGGAPESRRRSGVLLVAAGIALLAAGAIVAMVLTRSSGGDPPQTASSLVTTSVPARTETVERTVTATTPPPTSSAAPATTTTAPPAPAPSPLAAAERQRRFTTGQDAAQTTVAAACAVTAGRLKCWTPNDGFTLVLAPVGLGVRSRPEEARNRGREPAYPPLGFGERWRASGFTCVSRSSGLTCSNEEGHGWTLPRYRGLPAYF